MENCKLAYKKDAATSVKEVCWMWEKVSVDPDPEVFERRFIIVCDEGDPDTYSLRYSSYLCDPNTGEPYFQADLDYVTLKYKKPDGTWYLNENSIIYGVPPGVEIRLELGLDFIMNYLTEGKTVLGVFWEDFVPTDPVPPPELFDSNYEMLPVPPANQVDPVTEYQGIMRSNDVRLWICVGTVEPDSSTDTVITIETYNEAAPTTLVSTFTKSGPSGTTLTLDSSLYLLQDAGSQTEGSETTFSRWGGWITDPAEINEPYLTKVYPTTPQTVKLFYNVTI